MVNTRSGNGHIGDNGNNHHHAGTSGGNNDNKPNGNLGGLDVAQLAQVIAAAVAAALPHNNEPRQLAPQQGRQPRDRDQLLDAFCKRRPPVWSGEADPTSAEAWLKQIAKFLDTMGITNAGDRIALATFQLQGEADHWWDLIKATNNVTTMTWQQFEDLFNEKYFPEPIRDAMSREFMDLEQGTMTVSQYVMRFETLARHDTSLVATPAKRAKKFAWGLHPSIRKSVVSQGHRTFAAAVQCALTMERENADSKAVWNNLKKGGSSSGGPVRNNSNNNNNRGYANQKPYSQNNNNNRQQHQVQPWRGQGSGQSQTQSREPIRCFHCYEVGHFRNQCPKLQNNNFGNQPKFPPRSGQHQNNQAPPRIGWNPNQNNQNPPRIGWHQNQGQNQQQSRPHQNNTVGKAPVGNNQASGAGRIFALQAEEEQSDPSMIQDLPESAGFGDIEEQPYEVDPYNTGEIPGTESEAEYAWNPYQN